jgi:hypothetical protein
MTVKAEELAGAAVRRYLFPEPFVFDKQGYPHWERSTLPNVDSVYLGGFEGEFISLRNPNASHRESGKLRGRRLQRFAGIDRGAVMFVHLGFAASPEGTPGLGKSFNGADFDDSVLALLDSEIVAHWKTLQEYPLVVATPTQVMVIDDGDALFDRHPEVERYDDEFVTRMIVDARDGQMGIGCVVNAIVWFNLLWLKRESIVAELRRMQPSSRVAAAIRWMEEELPRSRMPMVASRLEEIIDAIKLKRWILGLFFGFVCAFLRSKTSSFLAPEKAKRCVFTRSVASFRQNSIFFSFPAHFLRSPGPFRVPLPRPLPSALLRQLE